MTMRFMPKGIRVFAESWGGGLSTVCRNVCSVCSVLRGSRPLMKSAMILGVMWGVWGGHNQGKASRLDTKEAIAIIDSQRIIERSTAFQEFLKKMEKREQEAESRVAKKKKLLDAENNRLMSLRAALPEKTWNEQMRAFEQKVATLQQEVQGLRNKMQRISQSVLLKIQIRLQEILKQIRERKGIKIVLERQAAPSVSDDIVDITESVLLRLNKDFPHVDASED